MFANFSVSSQLRQQAQAATIHNDSIASPVLLHVEYGAIPRMSTNTNSKAASLQSQNKQTSIVRDRARQESTYSGAKIRATLMQVQEAASRLQYPFDGAYENIFTPSPLLTYSQHLRKSSCIPNIVYLNTRNAPGMNTSSAGSSIPTLLSIDSHSSTPPASSVQ